MRTDEKIILEVLRDNLGDWKDIDSLRSDPRIYQRMRAHPGVLGQLLARLERRGEIERDLRGNKRIARAVMTPEAIGIEQAREETLAAPEPEPDPVTITYSVGSTEPRLLVGVTDKGQVMIGELIPDDGPGRRNWTHRVGSVTMLQHVLEEVQTDQARIARELYPPERPGELTMPVLSALAAAGPAGATTREVVATVGGASFNEIYSELLQLRQELKCSRHYRPTEGRQVWVYRTS